MGDRVGVQTDLVAFLLACIEEDERRIQATLARVRGWNRLNLPWLRAKRVDPEARQPEEMLLAEWDPERLLLECDTKRRIIEMFPTSAPKTDAADNFEGFQARDCGEHRTAGPHRAWCFDCTEWCYPHSPCVRCHGISDVLREMAVVYKDRPGYVEAWAPDGR